MKLIIKLLIVTGFVLVISWQVICLASKTPFNYDKYVENVERIEAKLAAASEQEANTLLMSAEEEEKQKAVAMFAKIIKEYEQLKHNPKQRQNALEKIAELTYWTGNYELSLQRAKDVLTEYPKSLSGSLMLARCYNQRAEELEYLNDYDGAILEYKNALEYPLADGLNAGINFSLGLAYERKKDKPTAVFYYKKIISEYPWLYWAKHAQERIKKIE